MRDQAVGGRLDIDADLVHQVVAERLRPRQRLVEAGEILVAGGPARLHRLPGRRIACAIEIALAFAAGAFRPLLARFRRKAALRLGLRFRLRRHDGRAIGRRFVVLQQRIALELLIDERRKLHLGKLQQLDRLLQLRRHHQGLRLAQIEALTHCHGGSLSP